MCGKTNVSESAVRVLSAARHNDPHVAARTADAGAAFTLAALRDWRPSGGQWKLRDPFGRESFRDESLPETTFVAPVQYALRADII